MTKAEEKKINKELSRLLVKLDNIIAGQRFMAMAEMLEAEKKYKQKKKIYEQVCKQADSIIHKRKGPAKRSRALPVSTSPSE
jgi:hypothetical protein